MASSSLDDTRAISVGDLQKIGARFLALGPSAVVPDLRPLADLTPGEVEHLRLLPYETRPFCDRVLAAHLDQTTDQSSRRITSIRRQVKWLHRRLPRPALTRVFHPLCGPGLFAAALRDSGTEDYLGIDISPAAIDYANVVLRLPARFVFREADALDAEAQPPPGSFRLALLSYEALNAFPPGRALALLRLARRALDTDGVLAAEVRVAPPHLGTFPPRSAEHRPHGSIFSDQPHLLLTEWAALGSRTEVMGHRFVVVSEAGSTAVHHSLVWRYSRPRLFELVAAAGFVAPVLARPLALPTDHPDVAADRFLLARVGPKARPL